MKKSFLKQRARQLKKEKSLRSHQALNEAAEELGYSNYKNYRNHLERTCKQSKSSKDFLLKRISSENDMSKKIGMAIPFIQNLETPFKDLWDILKLFQHSEEDMQFACKSSNLKNEIQQYWFNYFLSDEGENEIDGWFEYYVAKDISLSDLYYKTDEDMICVEGQFDLTIKFGFQLEDENDREKYPHFQDYLMLGTFEITIDRNKEINMMYSTLGLN